jgi:hypothetical protein
VNPDLSLPNVLAFVNHDRNCGVPDLLAVTTGHFFSDDGIKHPIYTTFSEGRIVAGKFRIHLYLWLDAFRPREFMMFNLADSEKLNVMCDLFGTRPEELPNVMDL